MQLPKRKSVVVNRRIQYQLLIYNWIYFLIIALSLIVGLFLPLAVRLSGAGLGWVQQGNLERNVLFLHGHLWPVVLLVFLLLSVHSLFISNKIVGPLRKFCSALNAFLGGSRWNPPSLRNDDLLSGDLKELSKLLNRVQDHWDQIRTEHDELHRRVRDTVAFAENNRLPEGLKANLLRLGQQSARMKRVFDRGGEGSP
ncbi:MAG: hypothetical protein K9M82_09525 [Deltaproteobacteria bacterium]|nr:hypothetical protein [Deltaproteobacteria bacterium]